MRVTNSMMSTSFLRDLGRNQENLKTLNNQLTSGKEIRRPSDNPFKVARAMQLHSDIGVNKQYNENIKDTSNWLETTDVALEQLNNSFQRIRELMVSSGNASYGPDEKRAIKDEINEKTNEISQILNTSFDGKYLFGGTKVNSKPVNIMQDPVTSNNLLNLSGRDGEFLRLDSKDIDIQNQISMIGTKLKVEITQGVTMDYSVSATDLLVFKGKKDDINVMDLLSEITNNLDSNDPVKLSRIINENLKAMDEVMANINKVRAEVGAKMNRMESAQDQNEEQNFSIKDILSQTEDIDFAEKTMEVAVAQSVYMASLQTSARILQPSLLDFLK
ncbi:flagellar hook-associated protein FlgL [Clostridium septicum]|uniref:Flagellar hook-associated protein 3 n=1 Tax=Clostridium septicum TaxID=1504 RepID=A0A9N7JJ01_CLOSE|nr:flagellar hook-associated protein FlgL [Clostridium septicum]AYE33449.1 flagellar hook-associated protein 3 [Clostridium septicum]MDU1314768.1 flagellar hook-associated protein FlgL [Clostridium septicum]QAS61620.1 flagellar hook-associated protein 3 [Clostridium septicum]UEC21941.1 flagellar hook-associated protein FlgL [Clostridium septicum]USS00028.1 flagellar hook-associated protein FlgL [Clostridium septicum]